MKTGSEVDRVIMSEASRAMSLNLKDRSAGELNNERDAHIARLQQVEQRLSLLKASVRFQPDEKQAEIAIEQESLKFEKVELSNKLRIIKVMMHELCKDNQATSKIDVLSDRVRALESTLRRIEEKLDRALETCVCPA